MRVLYAVSVALTVLASQALAQTTNLEERYVKACMKDGDTDAYCRCDFSISVKIVKDPKELELIVALTEKMAGLSEDDQQAILKKLPQDRMTRLIELSGVMEPLVQKCPGYKPRH